MKTTLFLLLLTIFAFNCKKDNAKPAQVEGISIKTPPTKPDYFIDEELNLSGLTVTLTMSDGSTKDFSYPDFESNGISCSPVNGAKANETNKTITITHSLSGKTISFDIVIDKFKDTRDGQVYKFVKIGNQIWMAENLRYKASTSSWIYNKDSVNYFIPYGRHYTRETAMNGEPASDAVPSGVKGICPNGWHLPSSAEFEDLYDYLNANGLNGNDLKETGTSYWKNSGGTNSTGFSAVGSGYTYENTSTYIKEIAYFHTTSSNTVTYTSWDLYYYIDNIIKTPNNALSNPGCIRCLQD